MLACGGKETPLGTISLPPPDGTQISNSGPQVPCLLPGPMVGFQVLQYCHLRTHFSLSFSKPS